MKKQQKQLEEQQRWLLLESQQHQREVMMGSDRMRWEKKNAERMETKEMVEC